jgi:anti-anti-sigma regulatory factor
MDTELRQIQVENRDSVVCIRLRHRRMTDADLMMLGDELAETIERGPCRALVVGLGFDMLECIYSMFLGILISTRRRMLDRGGQMHLCEVGPASLGVLKTCKLTELFEIHSDMDAAVKALQPGR